MKTTTPRRLSSALFLCVLALPLCGCSQLQLDPAQVKAFAKDVNDLVRRIDAYQEVAATAIDMLVEQGELDPNDAAKVRTVNADIDRMQASLQKVAAGLQQGAYSGGGSLLTLLEAAQAGNAASAPFNPYAPVIQAGLVLATALAAAFAKKKANEANLSAAKYKAHKLGVEKTMKEVSASTSATVKQVEAKLYENIGAARAAIGVK